MVMFRADMELLATSTARVSTVGPPVLLKIGLVLKTRHSPAGTKKAGSAKDLNSLGDVGEVI